VSIANGLRTQRRNKKQKNRRCLPRIIRIYTNQEKSFCHRIFANFHEFFIAVYAVILL